MLSANPALNAAADNDLYRICGSANPGVHRLAEWRRKDGTPIDSHSPLIAIAQGLLGPFAEPETLPDGVLAERMDLSDAGLDYYLRRTAA